VTADTPRLAGMGDVLLARRDPSGVMAATYPRYGDGSGPPTSDGAPGPGGG